MYLHSAQPSTSKASGLQNLEAKLSLRVRVGEDSHPQIQDVNPAEDGQHINQTVLPPGA